ncbi:MAG TPA: methylated-DNA--[protein]-cysteine S-methyltransferase [Solirubrobacteraceae bacterium]|nr:methylated-DNA--[protein]-cysteine S-methyltransferase [Solirubrobacteraceae bacterium]
MRQPASGRELERALRNAAGRIGGEPPTIERAARAAGLLDVAYATIQTPLGELLLASTPAGLACVAYLEEVTGRDEDAVLRRLAGRLSPRIMRAPRLLDRPRRELDEYLGGRRRSFELELDLRGLTAFARRVLHAAAGIPYGQTATYAQVAQLAGSPRGARAAGNALGANPLPIVLPCHRVVHADGGLGGYTGGLERKRMLLAIERGQHPPAT